MMGAGVQCLLVPYLHKLGVGAFGLTMHGCTDIVKDGHDAGWPLHFEGGKPWRHVKKWRSPATGLPQHAATAASVYRFVLDELAHDFVVEKVDRSPLNAFRLVLSLEDHATPHADASMRTLQLCPIL